MTSEELIPAVGRFATFRFKDGSEAFCWVNTIHSDLPGRELNIDVISASREGPLLREAPAPGEVLTLSAATVVEFALDPDSDRLPRPIDGS